MKVVDTIKDTVYSSSAMSKNDFPAADDIEKKLNNIFAGAEGIIKDMCLHVLNSGGKRLRPMMTVYSGLCFSGLTPELINTAVAAELIHMASLIHDDIIDRSDSRRGNNTVNYIHGNHAAVLAGDYIFAKAFAVLSLHRLLGGMGYLVEAIEEMCDGEVKQAGEYFDTDLTVEKYFNRICKKTAVLLSSCCKAGAAASDSGNAYTGAMGEYGINVGYAFQIIDDVLDFTGDEKRLGKPRGIDLMQGNVTLPVILLMEDSRYGEWIKNIIRKRDITKKEFYDISELLSRSGAIKKSYDIAGKCAAKAKSSIYSIPDSPYREILLNLAEKVISRDH